MTLIWNWETVSIFLDLYFEQSDDAIFRRSDLGEVWVRLLAPMVASTPAPSSLMGTDNLIPVKRCSLSPCRSSRCHSPSGANSSGNRDNVYLLGFWDAPAGLWAFFRTGANSRWPCSSVLTEKACLSNHGGMICFSVSLTGFWGSIHELTWLYIFWQSLGTRSIVIHLSFLKNRF